MLLRLAVLLAVAACTALATPGPARADVGLSNVVARPIAGGASCSADAPAPAAAPAGGHRDLCVAFDIGETGGDDLKALTIHLAPGLLGDPNGAAKCDRALFDADACPAESQVGTVANTAEVSLPVLPVTQNLTGAVYNLVPQGQEPARLGIKVDGTALSSPIRLVTTIAIRTTDYGLDSITADIPREAATPLGNVPIRITKMALTLWGPNDLPGRAMAKPFIVLPTSCRAATNSVDAVAHDGAATGGSDSFTTTDCDKQPYAPKFSATLGAPGQTGKGDHVVVDTLITQTAGEANSAKTVVTLPAGFSANLAALQGACPQDKLLAGTCPPSAKVGMVSANSPVLPFPLAGDILIVKPVTGVLPELSLELPLGIRLRATVGFAEGGRLQTIFPTIPDVPLDRLRVVLVGGKDGLLVAGEDLCRMPPPVIGTEFTSQGGAVRTATTPVTVPCTPKLASRAQVAGVKKRKPTARVTIEASGTALRQVLVTLPAQLRAKPAALQRGARVVADGKRLAASALRATKGRLVIGLPADGARTIQLSLPRGALLQRRLKVGRRVTFRVEGRPVSGAVLRAGARARAKK